jgi:hypothetical protein
MAKQTPDPMDLHGTISAFDGKMWDARKQAWTTPTAEGREYAAKRAAAQRQQLPAEERERLDFLTRVTTLHELPGHRTLRALGPVWALAAASGFTAGTKGNDALAKGAKELMNQAQALGANAVLGLTCSTFGAGGGITSVFGGDAVGVLLAGTAVIIEPVEAD